MRLTPQDMNPMCAKSSVCVCWVGTGLGGRQEWCLPGLPPPLTTPPTLHRARMSAAQCLAHPWLNNLAEKAKRCNRRLKSQILLKKYLMKRRWKVPLG